MILENELLNMESNVENANIVKDLVLNKLYNDKIINEKQYYKYVEDYNIIIIKRSWFSKWFNKLKKENKKIKDGFIYKYINLNK